MFELRFRPWMERTAHKNNKADLKNPKITVLSKSILACWLYEDSQKISIFEDSPNIPEFWRRRIPLIELSSWTFDDFYCSWQFSQRPIVQKVTENVLF